MKNLKIFAALFMSAALLFSCKREAKLSVAEQATEDFFVLMSADNKEAVNAMYPDYPAIMDPYSPDSTVVVGANKVSETLIKVDVKGYTEEGTKERDLTIYIETDSTGNFVQIDNSLGFCQAEEHELCIFAENIGAASPSDTTDLMVQAKLEEAGAIYVGLYEKAIERFEGMEVANYSWKPLKGGAEGTVVVENGSKYNVDNLRYCVYAVDKDGNVLACDTAVTNIAGTVESGAVVSDKFALLFEEKAKNVVVELLYDAEELAKQSVLEGEYTGKEYKEYCQEMEEAATEASEAEKVEDLEL